VVTRNQDIRQLILNACADGRLVMDDLEAGRAIKSQDAWLQHRKVAIGYRLYREKNIGFQAKV
jgi:hypothetical protein|tara:strand:- start:6084 stop:6272 length:189 start_codon:yes stop_codon:yes gene_type:complete